MAAEDHKHASLPDSKAEEVQVEVDDKTEDTVDFDVVSYYENNAGRLVVDPR